MPDVLMSILAQCMLGSWSTKPTEILHFLILLKLPAVCTHPSHWWRMPWNGVWRWASHSPLRGRQWMVPAHTWHRSMLRWGPPRGPYISRGAAAYPADMNKLLVEAWIAGAVFARIQESQSSTLVRVGHWGNTLVRARGTQHQGLPSKKRAFDDITGLPCETPKVVM